jgi:hypothetical protein
LTQNQNPAATLPADGNALVVGTDLSTPRRSARKNYRPHRFRTDEVRLSAASRAITEVEKSVYED